MLTRRWEWFENQPDLDPDRLVFIDETWASTKMFRTHGRALRGQRLRAAVPHGHWKTTTFVAGLRNSGMMAPMVLDRPINGELFLIYVEQVLVPELRSGDIVIMDMCGRPLWSKRNLQWRVACGSGADMCPAFDAAVTCRGPVWEFADRVQITQCVLLRHGGKPWFSRSRLADCAPYPPSSVLRLDTSDAAP